MRPGMGEGEDMSNKEAVAFDPHAAEGKPTSQSSTCCGGSSSRAVDGNTDTTWGGGSCTHTTSSNGPWWRVDLEQELHVQTVTLTNRCVLHYSQHGIVLNSLVGLQGHQRRQTIEC